MNKTTLLEGPVRGTMLRFALPIMLSMVTTRLYSMVDAMIVGLCLDADALAAVEGQQAVRHRSGQEEQQKTGEQRREPRPLPLPQDAGEGEARAREQEELQL